MAAGGVQLFGTDVQGERGVVGSTNAEVQLHVIGIRYHGTLLQACGEEAIKPMIAQLHRSAQHNDVEMRQRGLRILQARWGRCGVGVGRCGL